MPRYPKPPLFARVSDQLRDEILSGDRKGILPGIRILMKDFQVSKQTMMLALRRLEEYGYISPSQPGQARSIIPISGFKHSTALTERKPRVVWIAPREENRLYRTDFSIMKALKKKVEQSVRTFETIYFPHISTPSSTDELSEFLHNNPADLYLVSRVHQKCAQWLAQSSYPIIYMSGDLQPKCLPRVMYQMSEMLPPVIKELVKLGHQRIIYMQSTHYMSESRDLSSVGRLMVKELDQQGISASHYNCPQWGNSQEDFLSSLESTFKTTPPTALIVHEPWMIVTSLCFFIKSGIRYPDDVSLVCLEPAALLDDCYPHISSLEISIENYTSKLMSVIDEMLLTPQQNSQRKITAITKFKPTESIKALITHN